VNLKASLSLFGALVGTSCIAASAANQAPAIAAFDRTYTGITDYACILHVRETKGTQIQDRVYQYSFMNPHYVKTLILDGDGKGSGGVWIGGDQVSGHLGGILSGIHLKINLHDPRAVSLRGVTIPDGLLPRIIDDYGIIPGNPQPAPGTADKPGPLQVPQSKLLSVLGYRSVEIARNAATITDHSLQT
jgi:hypothetical protein